MNRNGRAATPNSPAITLARGRGAPSTVGAGPTAGARNLAGGQQHAGILRNAALANLSPRDPASRALTRATFRGRFAESGVARGSDRGTAVIAISASCSKPLRWPGVLALCV